MDRGGSREGGRPVNPPPPRHLLARTPRAASAGGGGVLGTTAPSPSPGAAAQIVGRWVVSDPLVRTGREGLT